MRKNICLISFMCLFFSIVLIQEIVGQHSEQKDEELSNLSIILKDDIKPDVYIDGKKYDADIVELLDQRLILSVDVIKGEEARKKYDATNGVVLITTKKTADLKVQVQADKGVTAIKTVDPTHTPLIVIDGKISTQEKLSKLSPDDIESISVLKGEAAEKKYKAMHGVVEVTTKQ